jgi:hypothetical protein
MVVENGYVRLEGGTVPVFASPDVTWDGTILTYGANEYVAVEEIILGGGEYPAAIRNPAVPTECGDGPAWSVARAVDGARSDPSAVGD